MAATRHDTPWWKQAVIYQIYPRSFNDSNDDGIGDIPGIIEKLDYLKDLGVDALWLSPVYRSPNRDYGYDISSYYNINPEYGTMDDMRHLIKEAKKRKLRIIMDLVLNHTSTDHPWFQASRDPSSEYRDYYIWRPGRTGLFGGEKAPNNWTSFFTGPAWQKDPLSDEYYLHLFTREQADLNYRNPAVVEEAKKIMAYWAGQGVAGFRCDVINVLYKESLGKGRWRISGGGQEHYVSQKGGHNLLKEFRKDVLDPLNLFTVGEATFVTLDQAKDFTAGDELDTVFSFEHVQHDLTMLTPVRQMIKATRRWQEQLPWNTIFLENHDQPRSVSTYGSAHRYPTRSAKALATLILTLRGTPFIYQGQEIGMTNMPFRHIKQAKDPVTRFIYTIARKLYMPEKFATSIAYSIGRDNARTPMQWSPARYGGFSYHRPWAPVNPNHRKINVEAQQNDEGSVLEHYRKMLELRKDTPALVKGKIEFLYTKHKVMIYQRKLGRKKVTVYINLAKSPRRVPEDFRYEGHVLMTTHGRMLGHGDARLQPYEALIVSN